MAVSGKIICHEREREGEREEAIEKERARDGEMEKERERGKRESYANWRSAPKLIFCIYVHVSDTMSARDTIQ